VFEPVIVVRGSHEFCVERISQLDTHFCAVWLISKWSPFRLQRETMVSGFAFLLSANRRESAPPKCQSTNWRSNLVAPAMCTVGRCIV